MLLVLGLLVPAAFTLFEPPDAETDLLGRALGAVLEALTPLSGDRLSEPVVEAVANALLFLPLGLLLPPALPRVPLTVLLALPVLGSLGLEVLQLLVVQSREPDPVDVLANGAGAAVGLLLGADLVRLVSGLHGQDTGR